MLNLDMVGRLPIDKDTGKAKLLVEGSTTAKSFDDLVEGLNKKYDFLLRKAPKIPANSDHFSFYQKKVPVLFFWTGTHADYHRPSDTADKINVEGMRRIVDMSEEVVQEFATSEKRPEYVANQAASPGGGPRNVPRLGIRFDYSEEEKGAVVDEVSENMPAAKAGIKAKDIIVEIAGKPIKNVTTYMDAMSQQKRGETVEMIILREGKKVTVKVMLE
jgi:C-terminal processing protease CtpA/Prc